MMRPSSINLSEGFTKAAPSHVLSQMSTLDHKTVVPTRCKIHDHNDYQFSAHQQPNSHSHNACLHTIASTVNSTTTPLSICVKSLASSEVSAKGNLADLPTKPFKTSSLTAVIPHGIYLLAPPITFKMDSIFRSAMHVTLVISLLLSSCCCGHVINKPLRPSIGRYPRAAQVQPPPPPSMPSTQINQPSFASSSPSSANSTLLNKSPNTDNSEASKVASYLRNLEPSLATATKSQLVAVLISSLEKLGAVPKSNSSFCLILDKITDHKHKNDSSFGLYLSFSLSSPDDIESRDAKKQTSSGSSYVTSPIPNNQNAINGSATCMSDPEMVLTLTLIPGIDGIPVFENDTTGLSPGQHQGDGSGAIYQSGVYGILETGRLSRTQVVVISTCSAIIGMFFLAAAFLRIRNYIKRCRHEQANAKRKKFRSCSVALRNPTSSMEQLRRESLASKHSQQNSYSTRGSNASQTNVSSKEQSSAGSIRHDPDTTPLLVITKAMVEQSTPSGEAQSTSGLASVEDTGSPQENIKLESSEFKSSHSTPNHAMDRNIQAEVADDAPKRSSTPDVSPGGSVTTSKRMPHESASLQGHLNHSYSHPRFLGSATSPMPHMAPHPKLASLKGRERGLIRASSVGTERNIRRQEFSRGTFKPRGCRRGNKVYSKSDASSFRRFAGDPPPDYVHRDAAYDNMRLSLDLQKNLSLDLNNSTSSNGSCLSCDAISKRLDLICNSVRSSHCPFNVPISRLTTLYNNIPGKASKLEIIGGSLDYGYRMSPLASEYKYLNQTPTSSVDSQELSPGYVWNSQTALPGTNLSRERLSTPPEQRSTQAKINVESDFSVCSKQAHSPNCCNRNCACQPIPETTNSDEAQRLDLMMVSPEADNSGLTSEGRRRNPVLIKCASMFVDSSSAENSPDLSLNRTKRSSIEPSGLSQESVDATKVDSPHHAKPYNEVINPSDCTINKLSNDDTGKDEVACKRDVATNGDDYVEPVPSMLKNNDKDTVLVSESLTKNSSYVKTDPPIMAPSSTSNTQSNPVCSENITNSSNSLIDLSTTGYADTMVCDSKDIPASDNIIKPSNCDPNSLSLLESETKISPSFSENKFPKSTQAEKSENMCHGTGRINNTVESNSVNDNPCVTDTETFISLVQGPSLQDPSTSEDFIPPSSLPLTNISKALHKPFQDSEDPSTVTCPTQSQVCDNELFHSSQEVL